MLKGITKSEQIKFIFPDDPAQKEADGATVFLIGALDVNLKTYLQDLAATWEAGGDAGMRLANRTSHRAVEAARFGVKGWINFKAEDGEADLQFTTVSRTINGREYQYMNDATAAMVPYDRLIALGNEVLQVNSMLPKIAQGFTTR